ncbi:defensin-like protein [Trifolium pratense]|uniref:Defensin-like protein n=1 Tax=Trifolium pratense TaxID=57577 RepID=A0A2K3NAW0_TRIPR|nr:defensin-like protein [Trifolium pratense]
MMDKHGYVNARLTSFLEKDNSFLTPWSWDPKACENGTSSTKEKEYITFPPGSYFSYGDEIIDRKNEFSFSSKEDPIRDLPHKSRILGLPQEYWRPKILFSIAGGVGVPICLDERTSDRSSGFGHYARVLVEIDLSKKLYHQILVQRVGVYNKAHDFFKEPVKQRVKSVKEVPIVSKIGSKV